MGGRRKKVANDALRWSAGHKVVGRGRRGAGLGPTDATRLLTISTSYAANDRFVAIPTSSHPTSKINRPTVFLRAKTKCNKMQLVHGESCE
ncbi:hypothetical protein J6590_021142 [Homalodisca vitripennis]|nr:hypothetical protein J6590_021142 [Homalodisca vitripennis]